MTVTVTSSVASGAVPFAAMTVNGKLPAAGGVPVRTPVGLKSSQSGRSVAVRTRSGVPATVNV